MTRQELIQAFTYPLGIHQEYYARQAAIENIFYQLYEIAGVQYPKVYSFKSPYALQLALNHLLKGGGDVSKNAEFYTQYPNFIRDARLIRRPAKPCNRFFWEFIHGELVKALFNGKKKQDDLSSNMSKYTNFCDELNLQLKAGLQQLMPGKGLKVYEFAYHPHFRDVGWVARYSKQYKRLESTTRLLFALYSDIIRNGLMYAYHLENMVLWCPLPVSLHLNELNQLHAGDEPAVKWEDDYSLYLWNGIKVRKRLIEFPESINRLDVLAEDNPEVRRCILGKLGAEKFASFFDLLEVDSDVDGSGYRQCLFRTSHKDDLSGKPYYFARLKEGANEREYFGEVPSSIQNVWEAMAYIFGDTSGKATTKGVEV